MFQISQPGFGAIHPESSLAHEQWLSELMQTRHVIEGWHCDLETGIFSLGEIARHRHALADNPCGLIDLIRTYDPAGRKMALIILEKATATASSFCYCTLLELEDGETHPVWCIGTSTLGNPPAGNRMEGIFAFVPAEM